MRADRPVTSPWPESVLSFRRRALQLRGSSPPVHSTMLVSSSRRPAPVNRLPLPRAPCYAHKKNLKKGKWFAGPASRRRHQHRWPMGAERLCRSSWRSCWSARRIRPPAAGGSADRLGGSAHRLAELRQPVRQLCPPARRLRRPTEAGSARRLGGSARQLADSVGRLGGPAGPLGGSSRRRQAAPPAGSAAPPAGSPAPPAGLPAMPASLAAALPAGSAAPPTS